MSSHYGKPTEIEIASLKKTQASYNVMLPGGGTPWEDRGAIGLIAAFFKTSIRSLFKHSALVDQIRRPETTSEATGYAIACGAMWGVSIAIWDGFQYYRFSNDPTLQVDAQQYMIEAACRVIGPVVFPLVVLKLATAVFYNLLSHDSQRQIPKVLVYNVFAYSLGPSLLAVIPVFGWVVAVLWILIDAIIGAKSRLYLRGREAVTNIIIAGIVNMLLFAVIWVAFYFVVPAVYGERSVVRYETTPKPLMNQ